MHIKVKDLLNAKSMQTGVFVMAFDVLGLTARKAQGLHKISNDTTANSKTTFLLL